MSGEDNAQLSLEAAEPELGAQNTRVGPVLQTAVPRREQRGAGNSRRAQQPELPNHSLWDKKNPKVSRHNFTAKCSQANTCEAKQRGKRVLRKLIELAAYLKGFYGLVLKCIKDKDPFKNRRSNGLSLRCIIPSSEFWDLVFYGVLPQNRTMEYPEPKGIIQCSS